MKALLYKEFKLSMHYICYIFVLVFPIMILIPAYPIAVGFIYVLTCYPILFLGANKGQQSNDLLYSVLLPVRKKDIVLARLTTVTILHFVFIAMLSILLPFALMIQDTLSSNETTPGLGLNGFVSVLSIALIGYAIADLIFFPIYYKHGKSIVASSLLMILGFVTYLGIFTIALPYIPGMGWYEDILCNKGVGIQFLFLAIALVIYAAIHFVVYRVSSKNLEKVDL